VVHTFDSGIAEPKRALVRSAVVARLAPLLKANGLYLLKLEECPRVIRSGTDDELALLAYLLGGQWPCVFVAVGRRTFSPTSTTTARDRYVSDAKVHVYAGSNNLRHPLARVAGDVNSAVDLHADPGVETILEHVAALLTGYQVQGGNGAIYQLVPETEDELDVGKDYVIFEQQYAVRLNDDVLRYKGITQMITAIRTRHLPDGVPRPTIPATVLTWAAPLLTFTGASSPDMAVGDRIAVTTGAGAPRKATIATLVSTDAITLVSTPDPAPAPGDTVYRIPDGVPTSEEDLP
jgi:hypothetical protein